MSTPHTPGTALPWNATSDQYGNYDLFDQNGHFVLKNGGHMKSLEEREANAEYIVSAVNAHADMLDALEGYIEMQLKYKYKMPGNCENDGKKWKRLLDMANEAIAKAKGETA